MFMFTFRIRYWITYSSLYGSFSENHEKECNRLSAEIRELQRQRDAEKKTYQLPGMFKRYHFCALQLCISYLGYYL